MLAAGGWAVAVTDREAFTHPRPDVRVCVIGNLNTDLIVRGVDRLPAWGQEVEGTSHVAVVSGQAGYLSLALARLGVLVSTVGIVGDDAAGRSIVDELESSGIDIAGVGVATGEATGLTVAVVRDDGERAFVSDFAASRAFDTGLLDRNRRPIEKAHVVCAVGLFNLRSFTLADTQRLLRRARSAGSVTVLDTGWDPEGWAHATVDGVRRLLSDVDVFLPNLDEAEVLTGTRDPPSAARQLRADGASVVVVKCGSAGSYGDDGRSAVFREAFAVDVSDSVGAGDVFNAGFLCADLAGADLEAKLELGNAAAALYVSRAAHRYPSLDEVLDVAVGRAIELPQSLWTRARTRCEGR